MPISRPTSVSQAGIDPQHFLVKFEDTDLVELSRVDIPLGQFKMEEGMGCLQLIIIFSLLCEFKLVISAHQLDRKLLA